MRLMDLYRHTDPALARVLEERMGLATIARAALASEASGQRGNSIVRAHSASEDARKRA
jgi:uncharacterized protein (DUF1501 family)